MKKLPGRPSKIVGIDFGIKSFMTLSDGTKIVFPPDLAEVRREITRSLKKIRSAPKKEEQRLKRRVLKLREKNKNLTARFLNKSVNQLIEDYDGFCVENINKQGMRGPLRKTVRAMPWRKLIVQLRSQALLEGKFFRLVSPVNTSRTCFSCGNIKEKLHLRERTYKCKECGYVADRDVNAAKNILRNGLNETDSE